LEESSGERLQSTSKLRFSSWKLVVKADHANVLLSGSLLRLDETSSAVDADDEAAGNFWVKSSTVASLLNSNM
jgi:hypothetical protein